MILTEEWAKGYTEKELPLVSIVTPSYNQGRFIRETIESVLNQDYPNIEYIVIDGGSTDETVEILKEYGNKIIWVSEKDKGQADAVNKGIARAKGKIIGWLNSDDTYIKNAVELMVNYMVKNPELDLAYGKGEYTNENGKKLYDYPTENFNRKRLAETCYICQPTVFLRSTAVEKYGQLDGSLDMCMDYEFWVRVASLNGKIGYLQEYIATSRLYGETKTATRMLESYQESCSIVKKYYGYVPAGWIYGYNKLLHDGNWSSVIQKYVSSFKMLMEFNSKKRAYAIYKAIDEIRRK